MYILGFCNMNGPNIGICWFNPCEFGASPIFVLQHQALAVSLCQPEQGEEGEEGAEEGSVIPQSSSSSSTGGRRMKILQGLVSLSHDLDIFWIYHLK